MDLRDLISQAEAARLREVTPTRINHLIKEGRLKVYDVAGRKLLSRRAVITLKEKRAGRPPKQQEGAKAS